MRKLADTSPIVRLVEEVPGVPINERWFIRRDGEPVLWQGRSQADGEAWAAKNGVGINFIEYLSNDM